ncbi:MAG: hypothetical protein ACOCXJ_01120 [Planctomycetota bacterium]
MKGFIAVLLAVFLCSCQTAITVTLRADGSVEHRQEQILPRTAVEDWLDRNGEAEGDGIALAVGERQVPEEDAAAAVLADRLLDRLRTGLAERLPVLREDPEALQARIERLAVTATSVEFDLAFHFRDRSTWMAHGGALYQGSWLERLRLEEQDGELVLTCDLRDRQQAVRQAGHRWDHLADSDYHASVDIRFPAAISASDLHQTGPQQVRVVLDTRRAGALEDWTSFLRSGPWTVRCSATGLDLADLPLGRGMTAADATPIQVQEEPWRVLVQQVATVRTTLFPAAADRLSAQDRDRLQAKDQHRLHLELQPPAGRHFVDVAQSDLDLTLQRPDAVEVPFQQWRIDQDAGEAHADLQVDLPLLPDGMDSLASIVGTFETGTCSAWQEVSIDTVIAGEHHSLEDLLPDAEIDVSRVEENTGGRADVSIRLRGPAAIDDLQVQLIRRGLKEHGWT